MFMPNTAKMELQVSQTGLTAAIVGALAGVAMTACPEGAVVKSGNAVVKGDVPVAKYVAKASQPALLGGDDVQKSEIDQWMSLLATNPADADLLAKVNEALQTRTYLAGYSMTLADIAVFVATRTSDASKHDNVLRWHALCKGQLPMRSAEGAAMGTAAPAATAAASTAAPAAAAEAGKKAGKAEGASAGGKGAGKEGAKGEASAPAGHNKGVTKKEETVAGGGDTGSMPALEGAEMGKVCTRFPPEPSGYLHIGHVKAVLLNDFYARHYNGKLIIRFDDTNPSKEKDEFEQNIIQDLASLGVNGDVVTHTSDYFDVIETFARQMIREGKAFMDDTLQEQMRAERMERKDSVHRGTSPEVNLARFEEMLKGSVEGAKWCMRAKINMQDENGTLRDPVMYRCNDTPHHRTGSKYKAYPTYDFACPIVDSIEGVTHALRTNEYHDRDAQYAWIQTALGVRKVVIHEFSRLNFIYTLLSKRKLTWFADNGYVEGWFDPRFPTVQGVLRRGVTVPALREFILSQGASKRVLDMEWDKFWSTNKKHIDPVAPRYTAVSSEGKVFVKLSGPGCPSTPEVRTVNLHPKAADVGTKPVWFTDALYLEAEDVSLMKEGEEITLMKWGNAIMRKIHKDSTGKITGAEAELHLEGDFKKTDKKVTWIAAVDTIPADAPNAAELCPLLLQDFDYLITVPKLEEGDDFQAAINPKTKIESYAVGEPSMRALPAGTIVQLERKGFYRVDKPAVSTSGETKPMLLFAIPDGRVKTWGVGSPAHLAEVAAKDKAKKEAEKAAAAAAKAAKKAAPAPAQA